MKTFKSPEEIAAILFAEMGEESKDFLRKTVGTPGGMILFHHTVGRDIRNRFELWDAENPFTSSGDDDMHPDEVSHYALVLLWHLVNESGVLQGDELRSIRENLTRIQHD